jgi:hypothetical protein
MSKLDRKTYFPAKTFDDDLDALVNLATDSGWTFSGTDQEQLQKDVVEQRADRASFDTTELEYNRVREQFGLAQEARYRRFTDLLNAARGAYRRDKAVMAQLTRFRRSARPSGGKASEEAAGPNGSAPSSCDMRGEGADRCRTWRLKADDRLIRCKRTRYRTSCLGQNPGSEGECLDAGEYQ